MNMKRFSFPQHRPHMCLKWKLTVWLIDLHSNTSTDTTLFNILFLANLCFDLKSAVGPLSKAVSAKGTLELALTSLAKSVGILITITFCFSSFLGFDLAEKFLLRKGTVIDGRPLFRLGSKPLIKATE